METRPGAVDDERLRTALVDGWGFDAAEIAYTPLGFGSHHWTAADRSGARRFVTVDDLDDPSRSSATVFAGLVQAFDTTRALREHGLDFVIAPVPALDGASVRRLEASFSIAVFPYVDGRAGHWGEQLDAAVRVALVERLAALHGATEQVGSMAPRRDVEPITRAIDGIARAMADTGSAWTGGPFAEPARHWLLDHEPQVRALVSDATHLVEQMGQPSDALVITHGEPHPGNVITTGDGLVLIDWDTVGLAFPERDLWMFADDDQLLARYSELTGRAVDPNAIALYDIGWTLADLSVYLGDFRSSHEETEDTKHAWQMLTNLSWIAR